jgi:hypothetical protein
VAWQTGHGGKHENYETNPTFKMLKAIVVARLNCDFWAKKQTQMNPNKANLNPL